MNTGLAIIILSETAVFFFLVYGYLHEDKFIAFEDRMIEKIRRSRRARETARRRKMNEKVCYTPERPAHNASSGSKVA